MGNRFDPARHHRRSIRLKSYDYTAAGAYFVTNVTHQRECLFGEIVDGEMRLNPLGEIAALTWEWLTQQYPYVDLDAWVVMPNHLHGILIMDVGARRDAPLPCAPQPDAPPINKRKPLGQLIGAFKTVSAKRINEHRAAPGRPVWQRNYYEHIIRNEAALARIRAYIHNNPAQWALDNDNPNRKEVGDGE